MARLRFTGIVMIGLLVLIWQLIRYDASGSVGFGSVIVAGSVVLSLSVIEWIIFKKNQPTTLSVFSLLLVFAIAAVGLVWLASFLNPLLLIGITVALAFITAIIALIRKDSLKLRRALSGKCPHCGYDLRASVERCPECGSDLPEELSRRRRIAEELKRNRQSAQASTSHPAK